MKIVIDIPDEVYKEFKEGIQSITNMCIISNAVFDGQVLPKNHGRLIDADALLEQFRDGTEGYDGVTYTRFDIGNIIDLEDTIIEADKEDYCDE